MTDSTCTAYEEHLNDECRSIKKINRYYGEDETSPDSAMCSAITNADKNHFYFCYPDLVSKKSHHTHACLWCRELCDEQFCSAECAVNFDLNLALEEAEQSDSLSTKLEQSNFIELNLAS